MKRKRSSFAIAAIILAVILIGILVWYHVIFKHTVDSFNAAEHNTAEEDYSVLAQIAPRGGSSDSWDKILGETTTLQGTIFDMGISNHTDYEVSSWKEKIQFTQDCYLNNGWCGTFEIHQFGSGSEVTQTVDLRNLNEAELILSYVKADQDILIELHSGDYVVYLPSAEVYEMPISAEGSINVGFILYYAKEETINFDQQSTLFFFNRGYEQGKEHNIYVFLCIVWVIAAVAFVSLLIYDFYSRRALELREKRLEESMSIFSGFVDAKDPYTNGHTKRVADYAVALAKELGYSGNRLQDLYYTSLMHDCGKCYVPDEILKKPGALTNEEYAIIKQHTVKGAELLENFTSINGIKDGALSHHERYDGGGYPNGLAGESIPEIGRILAIADAFDAMNSKRCYRDALSGERLRAELENGSGKQFDPKFLSIFLKLLDEGKLETKR